MRGGGGWWMVGGGHIAIVVATSLPLPTESTSNDLPLPSLPFAGFAEAIHRRHLRLLVPAGHNWRGGGGGGAVPRGGRGWGGSFWGMCEGGWRCSILLTSPSFPSLP